MNECMCMGVHVHADTSKKDEKTTLKDTYNETKIFNTKQCDRKLLYIILPRA